MVFRLNRMIIFQLKIVHVIKKPEGWDLRPGGRPMVLGPRGLKERAIRVLSFYIRVFNSSLVIRVFALIVFTIYQLPFTEGWFFAPTAK